MADASAARLHPIQLSDAEVRLLREALDSHEYWQLGGALPRNNGFVFIPGDFAGDEDRYWEGRLPTADEQRAINEVIACRALVDRLSELWSG
ncbi:MAG: hypothetical protein WD271_17025 [Acidimicrobiia bacterium]